jgi:hypothetical protein
MWQSIFVEEVVASHTVEVDFCIDWEVSNSEQEGDQNVPVAVVLLRIGDHEVFGVPHEFVKVAVANIPGLEDSASVWSLKQHSLQDRWELNQGG